MKGMALQVRERVRMLLSLVAHASGYRMMVGAHCNTLGVWLPQNCISFHKHVHHLPHHVIVTEHVYATFSIMCGSYLIACEW